jgi:hypothetical protein
MDHTIDEKGRWGLTFTAYFDDSVSDDQRSAATIIAGPVFEKDGLIALDAQWKRILKNYRIESPLHMVDFVRPHGKHSSMYREMKIALFSELATVINQKKTV